MSRRSIQTCWRRGAPVSRRRRRRRAMTLVLTVLVTAMALTLIAVTSVELSVKQLRIGRLSAETEQARLGAISALECALQVCNSDPSWRVNQLHGKVITLPSTIINGTYTYFDDVDSNLSNNSNHYVRIAAVCNHGEATQRATLTARPLALSSLYSAVHAGGSVSVSSGSELTAKKPASGNSNVINNGIIDGDVESVGATSNSGVITGSIKNGVTSKEMPAAAMMPYYISIASSLNFNSIPKIAGVTTLKEQLLSPAQNPYGSTNVDGVYLLDCGGQRLDIVSCRIVGTLILDNLGAGSVITNEVNWAPAVSNYPALLVNGSITISLSGARLIEATTDSPNYNPPGTPYEGASNTTSTDTYPCQLGGLVYANGDIALGQFTAVKGIVIASGNVSVSGVVTVTHDSTYTNDPPPHFASHRLDIVSGTWRSE